MHANIFNIWISRVNTIRIRYYWLIHKLYLRTISYGDIIHTFQIHIMGEHVNMSVYVCVRLLHEFKYATSHFIVVVIGFQARAHTNQDRKVQ